MSERLTSQQLEAYQVIDDATARTMSNPKGLAELIIKGINDQTTIEKDEGHEENVGHAETGFHDNSGVNDNLEGVLTEQEVISSMEKTKPRTWLPRTLADKSDAVQKPDHILHVVEADLQMDDADEHPMSEASEVASLAVQLKEITGVVNVIGSQMTDFMSKMESRLSTLESRVSQDNNPTRPHRRTVTGTKIPVMPTTPTTSHSERESTTQAPSFAELSELLERCKAHKFTPSKLAQKQIFISLADGKELTGLELPLTRAQWKPENLVHIVSRFS